jgi:hypothetical protein
MGLCRPLGCAAVPLSVLDIVIPFPTTADNLHDPAGDAKING